MGARSPSRSQVVGCKGPTGDWLGKKPCFNGRYHPPTQQKRERNGTQEENCRLRQSGGVKECVDSTSYFQTLSSIFWRKISSVQSGWTGSSNGRRTYPQKGPESKKKGSERAGAWHAGSPPGGARATTSPRITSSCRSGRRITSFVVPNALNSL